MCEPEICEQCGDIIDEPLTCHTCGIRGCDGCIDWCHAKDDELDGEFFCESCQIKIRGTEATNE